MKAIIKSLTKTSARKEYLCSKTIKLDKTYRLRKSIGIIQPKIQHMRNFEIRSIK